MNDKRRITVSKYLSKHLRHTPESIGLSLEPGGWVKVADLLAACADNRFPISREELALVVSKCDKQRLAFDATGERIRANQGHSTAVDLQLEPATPPDVLYHGTSAPSVVAILRDGLWKMNRHHVHLSPDVPAATKVGQRHGKPAVLIVDAAAMRRDGYVFYRSANGIWLVDCVPAPYLRLQ